MLEHQSQILELLRGLIVTPNELDERSVEGPLRSASPDRKPPPASGRSVPDARHDPIRLAGHRVAEYLADMPSQVRARTLGREAIPVSGLELRVTLDPWRCRSISGLVYGSGAVLLLRFQDRIHDGAHQLPNVIRDELRVGRKELPVSANW